MKISKILYIFIPCFVLTILCTMYRHIHASKSVFTEVDQNWGLSFQSDGKPPIANVSSDELINYNAYYAEETTDKKIYLTFDCGYENGNTEKILDVLKSQNVKAAFFVVGHFIQSEPELIKRMLEEGHIIGNHTMTHPDMSKIQNEEAFKKELESVETLYKKVTQKEMLKIYRPPQGKFNTKNLNMAKQFGYHTFFWSLAYVDWYEDHQPTKEEAFNKLIPRIHPGAIVLLHNTSKTNADILEELLVSWKNEGYSFHPLTDFIENAH